MRGNEGVDVWSIRQECEHSNNKVSNVRHCRENTKCLMPVVGMDVLSPGRGDAHSLMVAFRDLDTKNRR